jgi:putative addiction module killer protein
MLKPTIEKEILIFKDSKGKEPLKIWLNKLDSSTRRRIEIRLERLSIGNYGDYKKLTKELFELKFTFGAGYRIYFIEEDTTIVILLCGGDKKTQSKDIEKALEYLEEYKERKDG